jgi:hypothetical protein
LVVSSAYNQWRNLGSAAKKISLSLVTRNLRNPPNQGRKQQRAAVDTKIHVKELEKGIKSATDALESELNQRGEIFGLHCPLASWVEKNAVGRLGESLVTLFALALPRIIFR